MALFLENKLGSRLLGMAIVALFMLLFKMNKGAERMAEVSARFTLDAMPIKVMAIDADLNHGKIDKEEAQKRRLLLEEECKLICAKYEASKARANYIVLALIATVVAFIISCMSKAKA